MSGSLGATVKLAGYVKSRPPDDGPEMQAYRRFIVEAVEILYGINEQCAVAPFKPCPVSHDNIYAYVKNKIGALILQKNWVFYGYMDPNGNVVIRNRETVTRRVRECASEEFGAKIVAEDAGLFVPRRVMEAGAWQRSR